MTCRCRAIPAAVLFLVSFVTCTSPARAADTPPHSAVLKAFAESVQDLARTVAPSVVQVIATGYMSVDPDNGDAVLGRQESIGSGVIIDASGYIMTNQHVVDGASRVAVVIGAPALNQSPENVLASTHDRTVNARIIGVSRDLDLALLKVDAGELTPLPVADYDALRQGEIVFAFGSPEGLNNSVTMGVVSSVARQSDPDDPRIYIQTDAPINRGNSGGPLVNANGELVGINTFIVTNSGGNEGLGFAIPSAIVSMAFPVLRDFGKLHRGEVGIDFQTITPELASGLGLQRRHGVIVSDVVPGSAAETAGVKVGDIVAGADGKRVDVLPSLLFQIYTRAPGQTVKLDLLRGDRTMSVSVRVSERQSTPRFTDLVDPHKNLVVPLGVLAITIDDDIASMLPDLRKPGGVLVAARIRDWRAADVDLSAGDVIHAVNTAPVRSVDGLRAVLDGIAAGSPIVLQVEHDGQLTFVTFNAP